MNLNAAIQKTRELCGLPTAKIEIVNETLAYFKKYTYDAGFINGVTVTKINDVWVAIHPVTRQRYYLQ